ncbi:MAG: branched-chain amino acid aminotransferase, group [Bacillales bacterium]|jgi:branched-chain amino acid aminotransferase|nr:branched-chain amino acid aminotransferase, group [Bacillales bacterium]
MDIRITEVQVGKEKQDSSTLGFGLTFTDYMFMMDYTEGKGWQDAQILPYSPIALEPSAMVFHYGQAIFEGLKAYRTADGKIQLFRPEVNFARLNVSCERLSMPTVDIDFVIQALIKLLELEADWVPSAPHTSLYIRPFMIATEPIVGVRASLTYKFMIILSPSGPYYKEGINPVKIHVENHYVRAVKGGIGFAKAAGNYAAGIKPQMDAKEKGYAQVLWLDGVEKKYIEEVGTMNVFFKINGEIITPALNGSILAGVTRDSSIQLLKDMGLKVTERKISIHEVYEAFEQGLLEEAFGTGTAAVISPIGELEWDGHIMSINKGEIGPIVHELYETLTGIQNGEVEDKYNWIVKI